MNDTTENPQPQADTAPQQPPAGTQPGPFVAPAPMLESDARTIAMLVHILAAVAMVLSAGTLAFLVPLVMWLMYRERSALIDHHGKLNLNLQLTMLIVGVAAVVLGIVTVGIGLIVTIPLAIVYAVYALVMSIVAGVRANSGQYSTIPLVIRIVR